MRPKALGRKAIVAIVLAVVAFHALGCGESEGIEAAAQASFEIWAQKQGVPYRNVNCSVLDNDGTFAAVRIVAEFRESADSAWEQREAEIECRNVGGRWHCDREMLFTPAHAQIPRGAKTQQATVPAQAATTPPPTVPVPDVRGYSAEEACTRLEQFGLKCAEGEPRFDPYTAPGYVAAQKPSHGVFVAQGSVVTVSLCPQPQLTRVPQVTQTSYEGARLVLEQAGFRVRQEEAGCTGMPAGFVDHQDPRGGAEDIQGITVTLYVSIGDQGIMPELLGVPLEEAIRRIEQAGLLLRYASGQTQADMPNGVSIDQLAAPGQVISYVVHYANHGQTSGELFAGEYVPCGAAIDIAYYATTP